LVPRLETGKINRVRHLRYGRLSPGAQGVNALRARSFQERKKGPDAQHPGRSA
jgi:hypothetical protein